MVEQSVNTALRRVPPLVLYIAGVLPLLWLIWSLMSGGLGVDPVKRIEHQLGEWGLQLLVAGLAMTPLRRFTGVNLIRYRRAVGLLAFFYIVLHFATWLVLDIQLRWGEVWADILKRPYIMLGMVGLLTMVPLALTSNAVSIRRLGARRWRALHRLAYISGLAGAVHYVWLVKAWPLQPFMYLILIVFLLASRLIRRN